MPRTRSEQISNTTKLNRCKGPGRVTFSKGLPHYFSFQPISKSENYLLGGTADRWEAILLGNPPFIPLGNLQALQVCRAPC